MTEFEDMVHAHSMDAAESVIWWSGNAGLFSGRLFGALLEAAQYYRTEVSAANNTNNEALAQKVEELEETKEKCGELSEESQARLDIIKRLIDVGQLLFDVLEEADIDTVDGQPAPWSDVLADFGDVLVDAKNEVNAESNVAAMQKAVNQHN